MNDGSAFLIALALVVAFLMVLGEANGAEQPKWCPDMTAAINCPDVKAYVAEQGRVRALIKAKLCGASREQIREAKKCLGG